MSCQKTAWIQNSYWSFIFAPLNSSVFYRILLLASKPLCSICLCRRNPWMHEVREKHRRTVKNPIFVSERILILKLVWLWCSESATPPSGAGMDQRARTAATSTARAASWSAATRTRAARPASTRRSGSPLAAAAASCPSTATAAGTARRSSSTPSGHSRCDEKSSQRKSFTEFLHFVARKWIM